MERQYARPVMKAPRARWWDPRTWLAFMFWELRTIARAISDDGLSDWKATGTIVIFEILAIVGLTNAAAVYLGRRLIDKGSPFIFLVAFAVAIVNTPAILGKRKRWDRLSAEFEGYSPTIRIVGGFAVVLLVVAAIIVAGHFGAAQRLLPQ
jgi:uncharacterized membrane protein YhaH (DUF805 family)